MSDERCDHQQPCVHFVDDPAPTGERVPWADLFGIDPGFVPVQEDSVKEQELLDKVRTLHAPQGMTHLTCKQCIGVSWDEVAEESQTGLAIWPCSTALVVYTEQELSEIHRQRTEPA